MQVVSTQTLPNADNVSTVQSHKKKTDPTTSPKRPHAFSKSPLSAEQLGKLCKFPAFGWKIKVKLLGRIQGSWKDQRAKGFVICSISGKEDNRNHSPITLSPRSQHRLGNARAAMCCIWITTSAQYVVAAMVKHQVRISGKSSLADRNVRPRNPNKIKLKR